MFIFQPCISCKPENGNHSGDVSLNESKVGFLLFIFREVDEEN